MFAVANFIAWGIRWAVTAWSDLSLDEVVFQLTNSLEGTSQGMLWAFFLNCVFPTMVTVIIAVIMMVLSHKTNFLSLILVVISIILIFISVLWAAISLRLDISLLSSTFIEDNYVNPNSVDIIFPEKKRNLIYIYLESMEVTYSDESNGGAFEYNNIPEQTELAEAGQCFAGYNNILNGGVAIPGATWTTGAMFAQSTGLPLKLNIDYNAMNTQDSFFDDVVSIGDILESEGYTQELLIGSDANFGGRSLFYNKHGNYNILDYEYALKIGWIDKDYYVWWGYEDKKLFDFAKDCLKELSSSEEPFNFTLLTADTHFEDGYFCDLCDDNYSDQYANVIACSSRQVANFIQWCMNQEFYDDTTIVISGDHPTMDADFCLQVEENYERKVYTTYINVPEDLSSYSEFRHYSTFDDFPTTLAALGAEIDGNRLGLGVNLFSDEESLLEKYGYEYMYTELRKQSDFVESLSNIDINKTALKKEQFSPWANIDVVNYDSSKDMISVEVSDIVNVTGYIDKVYLQIGRDINNLDEKIECDLSSDGIYRADVDIRDITDHKGVILAYAEISGNIISLGEISGDLRVQNDLDAGIYINLANAVGCDVFISVKDDASIGFTEQTFDAYKKSD